MNNHQIILFMLVQVNAMLMDLARTARELDRPDIAEVARESAVRLNGAIGMLAEAA